MKKLSVILVVMLLAFVGCGKDVVKPSDDVLKSNAALNVLDKMREAHVARDMSGLLKYVSPDLKEGYSEFQTSLRRDMETYPKATITIETDRVVLTDNLTKVVFHWNGTWTDKDGVIREGRGNAVFGFKTAGENITVETITGDSPFGVVR